MSEQKIEPKDLKEVAGGQDLTTPLNPTPKQKEQLERREEQQRSSPTG